MRALLLAAGFGTRLLPMTETIPKCLVKVGGRPIIEHWIQNLASDGFDRILINSHYMSNMLHDYLKRSEYRNLVEVAHEPTLLGTGGTIMRNKNFFEGSGGFVIHADNYTKIKLSNVYNAHKRRPPDCVMTMVTFRSDKPTECGICEVDNDGRVNNFHEKVDDPPSNLANAAIYYLEPECFDYVQNQKVGADDISRDMIPKLLGKIFTYQYSGPLIDIGTFAGLEMADQYERLFCETTDE